MAAKASGSAGGIRSRAAQPRRGLLWLTLAAIVVLLGALIAGSAWAYRALYSPSAFVARYLTLLQEGRAADALELPGVTLTPEVLAGSEISTTASTALLRHAALAPLTDIVITEEHQEGDIHLVTASYKAGPLPASSQFKITSAGFTALAPQWRFAESPLAQLDLRVLGSEQFRVNNFDVDRLQINPDADPEVPMQFLVFSPGMYVISVDTHVARTPRGGVGYLSDVPLKATPIGVEVEPTDEFTQMIQQQLDAVLDQCVTKRVLLPANCPYGRIMSDRLQDDPQWSVVSYPHVTLEPRGNDWMIRPTLGTVHLYAPVRLLHDGTDVLIEEDVQFDWAGRVQLLPDGTAAIRLGEPSEFGY